MLAFFMLICIQFFPESSSGQDWRNMNLDNVINVGNEVMFQNKCIEDLGCFYTGPPFYHRLQRPVVRSPWDHLPTKFYLYTGCKESHNSKKAGRREEITYTYKSIKHSSFKPELPLAVLIHGFLSNMDEKDARHQMRDALLCTVGGYNVIMVDWSRMNKPFYPQAIANGRGVASQVAKLLKIIMKTTGLQAEDIHIIGHSLGAHIAGWIGERIPKLGRITGLDPAGPLFSGAEKEVRLDHGDARFVDVIHTDGAEFSSIGLGISEPIGHIDFYPNGGNKQPNCSCAPDSDILDGEAIYDVSRWINFPCNHERANDLFLASMNDYGCRLWSFHCNSYEDYLDGRCNNSAVAEIGFYTDEIIGMPVHSKFYLKTSGSIPFCSV